jgi:ribosomal protein L7/L12
MAEQPSNPNSTGSTATISCIEQLRQDVDDQINRFDALKLNELKTELEAFVEIVKTAPTEYKDKYADFKRRWCEEGKQIVQLHSDLLCGYPDWKKLIIDNVCNILKDIHDREEAIKKCKGVREMALDEAKEQLDVAQANLDAWKLATQKIEDKLTTNQGWITEMQSLNQGEDRAFGLYLLWFKLLPAHNNLMPDGGELLYRDETPEALCPKETPEAPCREVAQQGQVASPSQESHSESQPSPGKSNDNPCDERAAPWIINPNNYKDKLDRAFCCYKLKKEQYADFKVKFQAKPDSLAFLTDELAQKKSTRVADIKANLVKAKPKSTDGECA